MENQILQIEINNARTLANILDANIRISNQLKEISETNKKLLNLQEVIYDANRSILERVKDLKTAAWWFGSILTAIYILSVFK